MGSKGIAARDVRRVASRFGLSRSEADRLWREARRLLPEGVPVRDSHIAALLNRKS